MYSLEIQVLLILAQMELTGLHLEKQALYDYKTELQAKIQETEEKIYSEVKHPFNIASPKQLQTVLFEERKLPTGKKTKTGYSTDTSVLEELSEFRHRTKNDFGIQGTCKTPFNLCGNAP